MVIIMKYDFWQISDDYFSTSSLEEYYKFCLIPDSIHLFQKSFSSFAEYRDFFHSSAIFKEFLKNHKNPVKGQDLVTHSYGNSLKVYTKFKLETGFSNSSKENEHWVNLDYYEGQIFTVQPRLVAYPDIIWIGTFSDSEGEYNYYPIYEKNLGNFKQINNLTTKEKLKRLLVAETRCPHCNVVIKDLILTKKWGFTLYQSCPECRRIIVESRSGQLHRSGPKRMKFTYLVVILLWLLLLGLPIGAFIL